MVGTVQCQSVEQLMEVVAGCVKQGLVFVADAEALTVTLTGGY